MSAWASMAIRGANTIALLLGFACCSLARINMWSILINKPECLLPRNKVVNDHLLRECQIMRQWLNKAVPQPCISRASFPWKINKAAICCVLCCCKAFYLWLKKKKVIIQGKLCSAVGCLCFPPPVLFARLDLCCVTLRPVLQLLYGSPWASRRGAGW